MTTTSPSFLDAMSDQTPDSRNRSVDFLRAIAISIVVLWHWVFSITHWSNGRLTMPNPVGSVPGLWGATWILQVMPLFFIVGGYANQAGFRSATAKGTSDLGFVAARLQRLGRPVVAMVGSWLIADLVLRGTGLASRSVVDWGDVVFVPLWFLGIYAAVVALSPWTIRLDDHWGWAASLGLGISVVVLDTLRFSAGFAPAGALNSLLVFVFAHQLGYRWHDGSRLRAALPVGLVAMVGLVAVGPYPLSMVATRGSEVSNMFPTTAPVAALALLQLGLIGATQPVIERWCRLPRVWKATIALNAVAMTVFTWHMTALVLAIGSLELAGLDLLDQATTSWWIQRPLFVIAPLAMLTPLVALFARIELTPTTAPNRR